jgi:hypothetical protein
LDPSSGSVEFLLEIVETSESLLDSRFKRSIGKNASGSFGCKILPEQRVVDVSWSIAISVSKEGTIRSPKPTSTVELESSLESDSLLGGRSLGIRCLSSVQCVYVRLVVFGVVENHDFPRDVRLKSFIRVRELRKSVSHNQIGVDVGGGWR